MAEPTSYERLGGIFAIAAVVNNFSGYGVVVTGGGRRGQTVQPAPMAIIRPVSAVPPSYIRVHYLTVSRWWPR
jgi:hypothetical protein